MDVDSQKVIHHGWRQASVHTKTLPTELFDIHNFDFP